MRMLLAAGLAAFLLAAAPASAQSSSPPTAAALKSRHITSRDGQSVTCEFKAVPQLALMNWEGRAPFFNYLVTIPGPATNQESTFVVEGGAAPNRLDGLVVFMARFRFYKEAYQDLKIRSAKVLIDGRDTGVAIYTRQNSGSARIVAEATSNEAGNIGRGLADARAIQVALLDATGARVDTWSFDISNFRYAAPALSGVGYRC